MAEARPPVKPAPRDEQLELIRERSKAAEAARRAHELADALLKAACVANSYHLLPDGHPDQLTMAEMGQAMEPPRHDTRVGLWCQQVVDNTPGQPRPGSGHRQGLRDLLTELLGYDPVTPYDLAGQYLDEGARHVHRQGPRRRP